MGSANHFLDSLLYPGSLALVGASESTAKFGGRVLNYLVDYQFPGRVYPINNKREELRGLRCYPDLTALPEVPEVVVMAVANRLIQHLIQQCCDMGVKNAVIISSGFAEIGQAGRARQEEISRLAREAGLRIMGPNCLGLISSAHRMPLSSTLALRDGVLLTGNIGFVSQSGAVAGSFLNRAQDRKLGLRYMVSTGNEVDLEISDFIEYMVEDPGTRVVAAFVEGVRNPDRFVEVADKAWHAGKPIIALKVGRSERGAQAARSHTAALTGEDRTYDALFRQKGIVRVDTFDGLLDTVMLFSKAKSPAGTGIGVVSSSGGACGVISDRCAELGVDIPDLSPEIAATVAEAMGLDKVENPIDVGAMQSELDYPGVLSRVLEAYDADLNISAVLTALTTMPGLEATGEALAAYARRNRKPVMVLSTAGSVAGESIRIMEEAGIPVFSTTDECLKAIRAWIWRAGLAAVESHDEQALDITPQNVETIRKNLREKTGALTEPETKAILAAYGIPVTREQVVSTARQAVEAARAIGFPVALKIVSAQITHKTEAGAVKLNLRTAEEVMAAFDELISGARAYRPDATIEGVLVQEMVADGLETIAGVSRDPSFGPTIAFGLGGIFVELLRDVAIRLVPLTPADASEMLGEIKGRALLDGFRGRPRRDAAAVANILVRLSRLAVDLGDLIDELDLNPIIVLEDGQGATVVDALLIRRA